MFNDKPNSAVNLKDFLFICLFVCGKIHLVLAIWAKEQIHVERSFFVVVVIYFFKKDGKKEKRHCSLQGLPDGDKSKIYLKNNKI